MLDTTKHHETPRTPELADAMERIRQTEIAIKRTEEMVAANIMTRSKIRTAVDAAARLANRGVADRSFIREILAAPASGSRNQRAAGGFAVRWSI